STRSGQAGASALITDSAISCAQWFVQRVSGAGGLAHTTVPAFAITVSGRNVPSFFGVSGSLRYARAMATADRLCGYGEVTKPITWGWESLRSTVRSLPRLVTFARM